MLKEKVPASLAHPARKATMNFDLNANEIADQDPPITRMDWSTVPPLAETVHLLTIPSGPAAAYFIKNIYRLIDTLHLSLLHQVRIVKGIDWVQLNVYETMKGLYKTVLVNHTMLR